MRLAIEPFSGSEWMAGTVTIRDLLVALRTLGTEQPILELVEWWNSDPSGYAPYEPYVDGIIRPLFPKARPLDNSPSIPPPTTTPTSMRTRPHSSVNRGPETPRLPPLASRRDEFMRRLGIDCVFSVALENRSDVSTALLVLIYDLQHHHYPELLDRAEHERRDRVVQLEAERATRILVMSESVREDMTAFLPQHKDKLRVIHFVSDIPASVYDSDPSTILASYDLPPEFIYLPNQFWQHKNHLGVIQALERLGKVHVFPIIVCTGSVTDHRNPEYISRVKSEIERAGLQKQFLILGSVPRDDVFALMRQSVCVMNPSIFEGFGLSTSEAKSLGKRTLLSDLPALREHNSPDAVYFDPNNNAELAERMAEVWLNRVAGPDPARESAARAALVPRQREFAAEFLEIAREAIATFKTHHEPVPTL